jgi:hypothetical protein
MEAIMEDGRVTTENCSKPKRDIGLEDPIGKPISANKVLFSFYRKAFQ